MTPAEVLAAVQLPGATMLETLLAQAFIRKYPNAYDDFQFNVRLGAGSDPGPGYDASTRRMNVLLTQKRADMVTEKQGFYSIWELKARAGLAALGQLLGYQAMWQASGRPVLGMELGIITRLVDADVDLALKAHSIRVEIFDSDAIRSAASASPTSGAGAGL